MKRFDALLSYLSLATLRESWRMRVRGLHTYPTLSTAVTEFEHMAAGGGLLAIAGDGERCSHGSADEPQHNAHAV